MTKINIAIIGGGIIGTSTALNLIRKYPEYNITLIAQTFTPQTTSDGAAGHWEPFCMSGSLEDVIKYFYFILIFYILKIFCLKSFFQIISLK